jgi:hypothetical protein
MFGLPDLDSATVPGLKVYFHPDRTILRESLLRPLGPFYHGNPVPPEILLHPEELELLRVLQAVEIHVYKLRVFGDYRVGGTRDLLGNAEGRGGGLYKGGLAGPEISG